jgi:predicted XRE-type DNA-binding protein
VARAAARKGGRKLTPADVRKIRRLWEKTQLSQREIGEQFGVHQVTVSSIVRGVTWADV